MEKISLILIFALISKMSFAKAVESNKPERREVERSVLYYQGTYVPNHMSIFEGDDLILHFGNFSGNPQCLWSKELDFFSSSYQGKLTTSILKNLKPGTYDFSCPGNNNLVKNFSLTVIPNTLEQEEPDRKPSSVETFEWRPRDENDQYFGSNNFKKNVNKVSNKKVGPDGSNGSNEMDSYESYFEGVN